MTYNNDLVNNFAILQPMNLEKIYHQIARKPSRWPSIIALGTQNQSIEAGCIVLKAIAQVDQDVYPYIISKTGANAERIRQVLDMELNAASKVSG